MVSLLLGPQLMHLSVNTILKFTLLLVIFFTRKASLVK
jgi:hypothetical protein